MAFRILRFPSGLRAAAWYPTLAAEREFRYANGLASPLAENAPVAACGEFPVAVFSHGFGGCSTQTVFFAEQLALQGYIVVAPDHKDARCKVDEARRGFSFERAEEPFFAIRRNGATERTTIGGTTSAKSSINCPK